MLLLTYCQFPSLYDNGDFALESAHSQFESPPLNISAFVIHIPYFRLSDALALFTIRESEL